MGQDHDFQPHPVFYDDSSRSSLGGFIDFHSRNGTSVYVLADENTSEHCFPILENKWDRQGDLHLIEMPAGEENKNLETCHEVWQALTRAYAGRNDILINLGGGVVCDLGGFAASVYKRGMRFIHFPTSLLAMCDAAIGGKTGIDLGVLKNMVGTFCQPMAVFVDPVFLKTLPERELKNGFAEMLKHGLIAERSYFDALVKKGPFEISTEDIRLSVEIKSDIVIRDPYELNLRKSLNFGHTIGHALESYSLENDPSALLHGEAIILGMIVETKLSQMMQLLQERTADTIISGLSRFLPGHTISDDHIQGALPLMKHDKKNRGKKISFTLLQESTNPILDQYCNEEIILEALQDMALLTSRNTRV